MIKIEYGDIAHKKVLKERYVSIFPRIKSMRERWVALRKELVDMDKVLLDKVLPQSIDEILVAEFPILVKIYTKYLNLSNLKNDDKAFEKLKASLENLFNYTGAHQPKIAKFFMDEGNKLDLRTCHYCDMAYINVYKHGEDEKNHFDLDHILDKAKCPIVALSLFNFVPSCPICNERLKHSSTLGEGDEAAMQKLSPTSDEYTFEEDVRIELRPANEKFETNTFLTKPESYKIIFNTSANTIYDNEVKMFKLVERYNYHKIYALRLWDLKERYTEEKMAEIAKIFSVSVEAIREDVFGEKFMRENHRAFGKMHKDIMRCKSV